MLDSSADSSPAPAPPLALSELAATLAATGGFETRPAVAVAVSGGPDSLALTLLAARWAAQQGGVAWGLVVDHGLRPESAAEARTVAGWLGARGIPHEILRWEGDKPASGIQERAREARYHLLAGWCRAHGVLHLFVAHHREDQAETHLIRRRAGSGSDGLAAMSTVRELSGCRLVRPLLGVPKDRLAALLADEGQPFLRDPSNLDPVFARGRLRRAVAVTASRDHIVAEARRCGLSRIARERALDRLLAGAVALHPAGFAALDPAVLETADAETVERLLGRLAAAVGGARYPARRARLARLRTGLAARPEHGRTLGGCRFVPWRGHILVLREAAATAPPVRLDPGAAVAWDRRFVAALGVGAASGFLLGSLAQSGAAVTDLPAGAVPRLARPVLPALWDAEGLAAVPHLGFRRPGVAVLPSLRFGPRSALSTAGFTVV